MGKAGEERVWSTMNEGLMRGSSCNPVKPVFGVFVSYHFSLVFRSPPPLFELSVPYTHSWPYLYTCEMRYAQLVMGPAGSGKVWPCTRERNFYSIVTNYPSPSVILFSCTVQLLRHHPTAL